jgi:tetratricopeptide (TPR) repeat protein
VHPDTIRTTARLILALHKVGDNAQAAQLRQALLDSADAATTDHWGSRFEVLSEIGAVEAANEQLAAAQSDLEEAYKLARSRYSPQHAKAIDCGLDLVKAYAAGDKLEQAEELSRNLLDDVRRAPGEHSLRVVPVLRQLAEVVGKRGRFADAEQIYQQGLETLQESDIDQAQIEQLARELMILRTRSGRLDEARRSLEPVLALNKDLVGEGSPRYCERLRQMGAAFAAAGDKKLGEQLLRRAMSGAEKIWSADEPSYKNIEHDLNALVGAPASRPTAAPLAADGAGAGSAH